MLLLSLSLTMLFVGGALAGYIVYQRFTEQLTDTAFLERQLSTLKGGQTNKGPGRLPSQVRVVEAQLDKISPISKFPGKLHPIRISTISSEVSGLIREIPIEIGSKVKKDETLIAQIDRTWQNLMLKQNEAQIASLKVDFEFQMSELQRIRPLAESRAVSASDLGAQTSKVDQLQQELTRLQIANNEIQERLKRTTIKAPFDGYVVERNTDLGELVSTGTPIAKIISLGQVDARVPVVEWVVNRIKIGDTIPILIDKVGVTIEGKVHEVVPYAPTTSLSFPIIVRLDDKDGLLKAGMSATAFVPTDDPREGVVVPKDAVIESPDGAVVWVVTEEEPVDESTTERAIAAPTSSVNSEQTYIATPVPVMIIADAVEIYAVEPETDEGKKLLVPGAKTVVEGAEVLAAGQSVRITTINPELYKNLPHRSGQIQFGKP
ncbi:MAG: efflux RND transporter periplasmic adaptor subunit [Planctomycetaceae bacterium]|nr:efflux RND transporter periplasmic adaptor subunit [Planctomycetaceae bacterium]